MEKFNKKTGEIIEPTRELGKERVIYTKRPNGRLRIQHDFSDCPSMAEQHTAHLSNINYLIQKYKPDELAAYMAARNQYRKEIIGHDFSQEPDLQSAKNVVLKSRQNFEALPEEIRKNFKNHLEYLKFIDNPYNVEKAIQLGFLTKKQVDDTKIEPDDKAPTTNDDVGGGHSKSKKSASKSDPE